MRHWPLFSSFIVLGLLAACAQPSMPEDHFYRLTIKGPERATTPLPAGTIQVERFVADGLTANRPIAFSEAGRPQVLQTYHYHFWVEPPTALLPRPPATAWYGRPTG